MNLVATHNISYTNHTAVTNHSLAFDQSLHLHTLLNIIVSLEKCRNAFKPSIEKTFWLKNHATAWAKSSLVNVSVFQISFTENYNYFNHYVYLHDLHLADYGLLCRYKQSSSWDFLYTVIYCTVYHCIHSNIYTGMYCCMRHCMYAGKVWNTIYPTINILLVD